MIDKPPVPPRFVSVDNLPFTECYSRILCGRLLPHILAPAATSLSPRALIWYLPFVLQAVIERKKWVDAVVVDAGTLRDIKYFNDLHDVRRQSIARHEVTAVVGDART